MRPLLEIHVSKTDAARGAPSLQRNLKRRWLAAVEPVAPMLQLLLKVNQRHARTGAGGRQRDVRVHLSPGPP